MTFWSHTPWRRRDIGALSAPERVSFEVMHFVPASREVMAEVLLAAGPTAPTLCAGWEARHLAAHLVLREQSLLAAGLLFKPLAQRMETELNRRAEAASNRTAFRALINEFRRGAPRISPLSLPRMDHSANLSEFFIHRHQVHGENRCEGDERPDTDSHPVTVCAQPISSGNQHTARRPGSGRDLS